DGGGTRLSQSISLGSVFDGVTLDHATITEVSPGATLTVVNGLTMHGSALNFGGPSGSREPFHGHLFFGTVAANIQNMIGGDGSIELGGGAGFHGELEPPPTGSGVIGPGIQVHATALRVNPALGTSPGNGQIVHRGSITLDVPGGWMTLNTPFVN